MFSLLLLFGIGFGKKDDSNQAASYHVGELQQTETLTPTSMLTPTLTLPPIPTEELTPTLHPTPTLTPTPVVQEVSIVAVGDDLLHKKAIQSGLQKEGSYNYDHLYEHLKDDFEGADLAIMNQETIMGTEKMGYSGYPRFNSPVQVADALYEAGFDVILHATNHVMDMGVAGIENTLLYWKKYDQIEVIGIHDSVEDSKVISVVERNGIKIALLNYTYGTNGISIPKSNSYMVDLMDEKKVKKDIKKAKKLADFVIVFPHWGTEYVYKPNKYQKQWTKFFAEQGVDLVIGTHPHVLQPVEWVTSSKGHKMLVYYSLGNYVSTMDYTDRMLGGMAQVTIIKEKNKTYIKEASLTPIVTHYERGGNYNLSVYKLSNYTEKLAKKHYILADRRGRDFSIKKLNQLANDIIGDFLTK